MAGVDTGGRGGPRRAINHDINMIPFIDLLMVTIAFLLITAVWATNARLSADAQVPGPPGCGEDCGGTVEKKLHVHVDESSFRLAWKQGATVVSETTVPKSPVAIGQGPEAAVRYPDLAVSIENEWAKSGGHRDPTDKKFDQAVLHTDDRVPFREIAAVLDAIKSPKRSLVTGGGARITTAALNPVFATR